MINKVTKCFFNFIFLVLFSTTPVLAAENIINEGVIKKIIQCSTVEEFKKDLNIDGFLKIIKEFFYNNAHEKLDFAFNELLQHTVDNKNIFYENKVKLFHSILESYLNHKNHESYYVNFTDFQSYIDSKEKNINHCLFNKDIKTGLRYLIQKKNDKGKILQERQITINATLKFGKHELKITNGKIKFHKDLLLEKFNNDFVDENELSIFDRQRVNMNLVLSFDNLEYKGNPSFESLLPLVLPFLTKQNITLSFPLSIVNNKVIIESPSGSSDRYYRTTGFYLAGQKDNPMFWIDMRHNMSIEEKERARQGNNWLYLISTNSFDFLKGLISNIKMRIGDYQD